MPFELPSLPYEMGALAPHISKETLEYHYGKHHKAYLDKLNTLLLSSELASVNNLEEIIQKSSGALFNSAAQVWNHTFYWNCLSPQGGGTPTGKAGEKIQASFGSFEKFREEFSNAAINHFGSGWTWLVLSQSGKVVIENTGNAHTPISEKKKPVLTIDVWEHAYYVDYRNARPKYIEAFWNIVNWDFVNKQIG